MIEIRYLEVQYGRRPAALSIERLDIAAGERVAVIGPSGAGKSTLLRTIKGYIRPVQGSVVVMGVDLAMAGRRQRKRVNQRIGLIYQQFHIARRLTVWQNVLCGRLGLTNRWRSLVGWFSEEDRHIAWSAICEVGLREKVHERCDRLSGGEQQRVAVARVLAQQPSLILADEPVSSVDPRWAEEILELITEVQAHHEVTLVMSLHQPDLARRFAKRIIGLRKGHVVFDADAASVNERHLKELYGGDEVFTLDSAPVRPGTGVASSG